MLQYEVFKVKRLPLGDSAYVELFLDRIIDISELQRLANQLKLPVEAENGRAFPEGMGAKDFIGV